MRTVLTGTPTQLLKVRARDLPRNLDHSYFRWVDISGLDLTGYSMRDVDLYNYKATGTKFPRVPFSEFRFPIDLTGCQIPPGLSACANWDLVTEVFKQATNATHPLMQRVIKYLQDSNYWGSWHDGLWHMLQAGTEREVHDVMLEACQGYPRFLTRLKHHFDNSDWGPDMMPRNRDYSAIEVPLRGTRVMDLRGQITFGSYDRWALARMLETYIKGRLGAERISVYFAMLQPEVIMHVMGDNIAPDVDWQSQLGWDA